jgi:hypothetical protein
MRTANYLIVSAALSVIGMRNSVHAETPDEIRTRILMHTKMNYVRVESLSVPVSQYKGDGDPTTIEVLMLSTDSDGPSRVSDDGEVIILHDKDSKELMRQLIQRALEIKIAKALSGT